MGEEGSGNEWAGEDCPAGSDQAAAGADAASLWCRLIDSRGGEARKTALHAAARGGIDLHLKPPYFLAQGKEVRFERPSLSPAIRTLYLSIYLSISLSLSFVIMFSLSPHRDDNLKSSSPYHLSPPLSPRHVLLGARRFAAILRLTAQPLGPRRACWNRSPTPSSRRRRRRSGRRRGGRGKGRWSRRRLGLFFS